MESFTKKVEARPLDALQGGEVLHRNCEARLVESRASTALGSSVGSRATQLRSFSQLLRAAKAHRSSHSHVELFVIEGGLGLGRWTPGEIITSIRSIISVNPS